MDIVRKAMTCSLSRPEDVFKESYHVFDLTQREAVKLKEIKSSKCVLLCTSFVHHKTSSCYEIFYVNRGTDYYSIFRSKSQTEAEKVFGSVEEIINEMLPFYKRRSRSVIGQKLRLAVPICVQKFEDGWTSAHVTAQLKMHHIFENEFATVTIHLNKQSTFTKLTPLNVALMTKDYKTVKAILELKPNMELLSNSHDTVLHYAAKTTPNIYSLIWNSCTEVHPLIGRKNVKGWTPLGIAVTAKEPNIVSVMLANGMTASQMSVCQPGDESGPHLVDKEMVDESSQSNDVIKFTQSMILDLNPEDIICGGSPLHWCMTRRTLEIILKYRFDTHGTNLMNERPIHILVKRSRFRALVGLLSYDHTSIEGTNTMGETALHYAVKDGDISVVQALIVFDSDVDALDVKGRSPRHVAATQESREEGDIIIHLLDSVGAKRCSEQMEGCQAGCSHDGTFNGRPLSKWITYEDETLYKKMLLEQIIQQARRRKKINRFQSSSQEGVTPSQITYESMKSFEQNNEQFKEANMISLDGGGIRGLITAQILIELDRLLKYPIYNYFQWMVGTSTGGMIASLVCLKYSPQDIRKAYFLFKDKVIKGRRPYPADAFDTILREFLGAETKMSEIQDHKLVITGVLADRIPPQLHLFRSYHSPAEICGIKITNKMFKSLPNCDEQLLWSACRASGSAPSYFNSYNSFIDGGVIANNPTLDALTEFTLYNEALRTQGRVNEMESLSLVLSVGTGKIPVKPRTSSLDLEHPFPSINLLQTYKNAIVAKEILFMLLDEATVADNHVVDRAMSWCRGINVAHFRISPPLSVDLPLNTTDDVEVINALYETKAYMFAMRFQLKALCELLDLDHELDDQSKLSYRKESFIDAHKLRVSMETANESTSSGSHKGRKDGVRNTLKRTKETVEKMLKMRSKTAPPASDSIDYSVQSSAASPINNNSDGKDKRGGPPGPPASPSNDPEPLTQSDIKRDLEKDFKLRDAVLDTKDVTKIQRKKIFNLI